MLTSLNQDLYRIAAQASSLSERLQTKSLIPFQTDPEKIEERLETWRQVIAKGDQAKFLRRLTAEGWKLDEIRAYLGDVEYIANAPLPAWAETLQQLMQTIENGAVDDFMLWQFSSEPKPFEPFYAPCLQLATQKLAQVVQPEQWRQLSETAQRNLQAGLLERLITLCTCTLFQEFSQFRSSGNTLRDFFKLQFKGRQSQQQYDAFLRQLFQSSFYDLFQSYPVLGRLVVTTIEFWVETTAEFVQRLTEDWSALTQHFSKTELRQVVEIKTSLSDPHNRGRSAFILTFDTELSLVYKPKNLGTDTAYFGLLQWCNDRGISLPFQCLQVLNRGTYGWIEYVSAQPCEDQAAVQRFYQRSGMLLSLIYVLEGTDCHHENLIACAEQPILIDTETLLTSRMATTLSTEADSKDLQPSATFLAGQQLSESVLRTMLLPQWDIIQNDHIDFDLSGFGGGQQQHLGMQWRDVNTDTMQLEMTTVIVEPMGNAPTLNGVAVQSQDYLESLVLGFEQMYQFLLQQRSHLLGVDSPLHQFANETLRYVFRATNTYAMILQQSYRPELLRAGVDRSIGLDVLSRAFLTQSDLPNFWPMLEVESLAMEQMDVPFFTLNATSEGLKLTTGKTIPNLFTHSGLSKVQQRITELSPAAAFQQVNIIRGTFDARFFQEPPLPLDRQVQSVQAVANARSSQKEVVQEVLQIAESLRQSAIVAPDHSVTWLGLSARPIRGGFMFGNVGVDFFNGGCGIALFFAAIAHTTGDQQWRDFTLQTLQPLRHTLTAPSLDRWVKHQGMSGTTGLAGIVYGLVQISHLLEEPTLLQDAQSITALIQPEASAKAPSYDINRGVAGMILGLLALPQDQNALKMALLAGEYLLQNQLPIETGGRAWKTGNGQCLTGFYQGAAGIAYALLRLFAVTQDFRLKQAAQDAIAYEQAVFSAESVGSWAKGAAGIGLARVGGLSLLDTPAIRQDITLCLEMTQKAAIWGIDSLCWGNLGRIETLLVAAQQLNRPELQQQAECATAFLVQQAKRRGHFKLLPKHPADLRLPGLFHGLAGVGYQVLRVQNPHLPSVLLWENHQ